MSASNQRRLTRFGVSWSNGFWVGFTHERPHNALPFIIVNYYGTGQMDNSSTTSTDAGNEAEGTFDSVLDKAGALWNDTTDATGKVTQSVKGKVDDALGDGNLGEAVDDVANRLSETASALGEKASTLRTDLGGKAGSTAEQAKGFFSENLDHLINFTKSLFGG